MIKYISKRVVQIIILLFIYVTVVYWLMEAMPGSFIDQYLMNPKLTPEAREAIKKQFGYDKPAWERYLIYMKNFMKGDLGTSFTYYPRKVFDIIKERLPRTIFLFVTSTLISYIVGYNLGKRIAWNRGKASDKVATFVGIVFWTIFTPILITFNIWFFAIILKNSTVREIFIAILTSIFSYMAGHSVARKILSKKKTPNSVHAFIVTILWLAYAFMMLEFASSHFLKSITVSILFPTVTFYLLGYMIGSEAAGKLFRIYGRRFEEEGTTETVLWTAITPILMVISMIAFDVILKNIPLNQFIDPEVWKSAPFGSQQVFLDLLWSGLILVLAYTVALGVSVKQKTIAAKKRWFWGIMTIAFVGIAIWWINAKYVDPNTMREYYMGRYAADILMHMILPILTLTVLSFAGSMLVMRDTMLEIIKEDYITTAKAKGLPDHVVRDKHAARNALLPLVTNFVISLGFTVGGGVITETMFSWPGMGMAYLEALRAQDIPLLVGLLVFTGIFVLFAHLIADILYAFLDPRIRY